jgi:preprotein translocase subunit SecA
VKDSFNVEMTFAPEGTPEKIQEQIFQVAEKIYSTRLAEFGDEFHRFCQLRYLATLDQLWKDHLLAMDHLRQGIGLRGYGQKDPKQEYKKEGYEGFIQMLSSVKHQFVGQLMRAVPKSAVEENQRLQREMQKNQRRMIEGRAGEDGKLEPQQAAAAKPVTRTGPRVGRNDPCPCGSGKKFKKCHGSAEAPAID